MYNFTVEFPEGAGFPAGLKTAMDVAKKYKWDVTATISNNYGVPKWLLDRREERWEIELDRIAYRAECSYHNL